MADRVSKGSRWYLERAGLAATLRAPAPRIDPGANPVHRWPLSPPLALPGCLLAAQGDPPPDRGLSDIWPHGADGEAAQ